MPVSDGASAGGMVASGGGGVSDGVGAGAGSAGIGVVGALSAGGVVIVSSFLAQPLANNAAVTASKAKARMASSSRKLPMKSGSPTKRFTFAMVPTRARLR